jgi:HK97 gp10 family phage protein
MMVQGLENLNKTFREIPQKVLDEVAKQLEKEATKLVGEMKRLAPIESGALRDSIGWTWGDAPKGSITVGKVRGTEYGRTAITIYAGTRDKSLGSADAFYAVFQEFGTVKMAANPFFFPVWRSNKTRVRANIKAAVGRAIKKA